MKPYIGLKSKKQQNINANDVNAVIEILNSNNLTQGPAIELFETKTAEYCKVKYSVAVNSATSALHLACLAVDLGPGDILWTTPNTFVASANCGYYCGADVDFVDISSDDYNIDVDQLEEKLVQAKKKNKLPKVVIPIHFGGEPAKMKRIHELAKEYGFFVFEDASHALGADYFDSKIGSCEYADAVIFSFHPVKITTTGEGGMLLTNNKEIADKVYQLRSHGITRDSAKMFSDSDGPWYYQQLALGYNYRLTDIQAALGISQLSRVDAFVNRRREIADFYDAKLINLPLSLPKRYSGSQSSWHLYVIRLQLDVIQLSKKKIFEMLWDNSVPVNVHYIPVHTQPYYQSKGFKVGSFPNSEKHYQEALSLPIHCNLEDDELEHIVTAIRETLNVK